MPPKGNTRNNNNNNNNNNMTNYIISNSQEEAEEQPQWAKKLERNILEELQKITDKLTREGEEIATLKDSVQDLEFHSRKYNLLLFGLKPQAGEDVEKKVLTFFKTDLNIAEAESMMLAACHPLPANAGNSPAIIARFVRLRDRDLVLRSLKNLKGKNRGVTVMTDLPKEAREKRRMLSKCVSEARKRGEAIRLRERGINIWIEELKDGKWLKRN
jgi:hypothetical protein